MTLSGRPRKRFTRARGSNAASHPRATQAPETPLREFAYLDEVSVQSLLVSLIGELPAEVTSLTQKSREAELSGTVGVSTPLVAKAELTSRFKGAASSSTQVLSRAVAESLFKNLYELVADRLVWSVSNPAIGEVELDRGSLIEVEVELAPDPIYGFNAPMGVLSDLSDDYPPLLEDPTVRLILAESGPVNKVLERLLVGLIPLKAKALGLVAGEVGGRTVAASKAFFAERDIETSELSIVGVTEQEKYWRDVRRVLFTHDKFTLLGRIGRAGVQTSWTPVKLTELMREIAPQFPDAITRVGKVGYSAPVNVREEANADALQRALVQFAYAAAGEVDDELKAAIENFAADHRHLAKSLVSQRSAFQAMSTWLVDNSLLPAPLPNERELRIQAAAQSGLKSDSVATKLSDFASSDALVEEAPEVTALIDLEVIAIYW